MAKYILNPLLPENVPAVQFFSNMLIRGAAQFKEALFNGNPIAVATV